MILSQPFHILVSSPWPFLSGVSAFNMFMGIQKLIHEKQSMSLMVSGLTLGLILTLWWRDTSRESLSGAHSFSVKTNFKLGMIFFILSEVCIFVSLFWTFYHSKLSLDLNNGMTFPPQYLSALSMLDLPLANTIVLLSSSISISWSHYCLLSKKKNEALIALGFTMTLGVIFTLLQVVEFSSTFFSGSDSVFGACFFLITGFHASHVIIGTILLTTSLMRMISNNCQSDNHFIFTAAAWYWHFVDLIWLFVYMSLYT